MLPFLEIVLFLPRCSSRIDLLGEASGVLGNADVSDGSHRLVRVGVTGYTCVERSLLCEIRVEECPLS